jgi:hypothetical protein
MFMPFPAGMMAYEKALRLMAAMERPNPGISETRYYSLIEDLVRSKFTYVVASQVRWWRGMGVL